MEKETVDSTPLLSPTKEKTPSSSSSSSSSSFLVSATKWVIKYLICIIFIGWAGFIFLMPEESVNELMSKWINLTTGNPLGTAGSIFMLFSAPILIIAFLAIAYLLVSGEDHIPEKKSTKYPSFRLWTFPVIIKGPFGVVSATELIGIVLFSAYVIFAIYNYTMRALASPSHHHLDRRFCSSFHWCSLESAN